MREFHCNACGKLLFLELLTTGLVVIKCRCGKANFIGDLDIGLAGVVDSP